MFRSRSWFGGGLWKPKNPHSLEHLKYLYNVLSKNQTVSENNRGLLVETLRSIAEILIWGDQNDSSVFDFFLEKNMLSFFLKIMRQKCGSYVCVQLLQTLNILFENIRNETSLYYLLSNNHVNSIIVHKFDFSDEEVMAYYISFLKTLSFKLNTHTIHFFYNEHTNDFPLYTEAIKFFNHSESMVRIAVRTLTLNVYRVDDKSMLKFIGDRTAAPYFSNLVWFIGNHVLELDNCVRNDADHHSKGRLADLVAEHLDHLHYLNDILCLEIGDLNCVLTDQLLHRLLMPLYVLSLANRSSLSQDTLNQGRPFVSRVVALFLLSQVFLIITHAPLVHTLAWIILNADSAAISDDDQAHKLTALAQSGIPSSIPKIVSPPKPTVNEDEEMSYEEKKALMWKRAHVQEDGQTAETSGTIENGPDEGTASEETPTASPGSLLNITDEEKEKRRAQNSKGVSLVGRPFLEAIFGALDCNENDYVALFALCLLYSMGHNKGVNEGLLDKVLFPAKNSQHWYNGNLIERLIHIISLSCQANSKVRLVSLEMSIGLLQQLVLRDSHSYLHDGHLAVIEGAREESTGQLRTFYKGDEIFLDMFEEECHARMKGPLNVEWLMMDSNILLPPTGTPMTGIEFSKRHPCGEGERTRRTIRAFLLVREISQSLGMGTETHLPLTNQSSCVQVDQVLDLNNSDLIACTVVTKDGQKIRRFLVIDVLQLILVEPDTRRLGWGVAKFVGFLQDLEVSGDKDDSRCLHITVHRPLSVNTPNRLPLLSAKFVFDDHIRCMAAKQRLSKGRNKARQKKMQQIARLLEIPANQTTPSPPTYSLQSLRLQDRASRNLLGPSRPLFSTAIKAPGFAAAVRREERGRSSRTPSPSSRNSAETSSGGKSRDGSPRMPRPRSEEIPLEDMASSSQEVDDSSLPMQDPTSQTNSPSISSSGQQNQVGRGATRRRHMEASRRLLSPSPRRASESPSRLAQVMERSSSPSNSPSSTPPIPNSHPETETSFMELPRNSADPNGNPSPQNESSERKKKKGAVEII